MKKYIFLLYLLLFLSNCVLAQTQIDKNISIKIPETVQKLDTISNNTSVLAYYSKNENDSYIIMKESKILRENEKNVLDADLKSLQKKYHEIIASQIDAMSKNGFVFKDSIQIKINNFLGYKLIYNDIHSDKQNAESILLYLNGSTYVINYSKVKIFNEKHKNAFFDSLRIENVDTLQQIVDKPTTLTYLKFILPIVFLIGVLFYLKKRKGFKKSINN